MRLIDTKRGGNKKVEEQPLRGMDVRIWGPGLWAYLHCWAASKPRDMTERQIRSAKRMLNSFKTELPCIHCRRSYKRFIQEMDVDSYLSRGGAGAEKMVYDLHEKVNNKLRNQGKKLKPSPTYSEVRERFHACRASCKLNNTCRIAPIKKSEDDMKEVKGGKKKHADPTHEMRHKLGRFIPHVTWHHRPRPTYVKVSRPKRHA